jgi:hypothetical protein
MLPITHGVFPDKLVPVTRLMLAKSGTGNLWGRLTETVRVFIFPNKEQGKKARLAFMSKEDVGWHTLCDLEEVEGGWRGIFGLGFIKVKKNPRGDNTYDSWNLYLSPFYGEVA